MTRCGGAWSKGGSNGVASQEVGAYLKEWDGEAGEGADGEGMKGEFGVCRVCELGRSSEHKHPRKSPAYRASEQLELVHTDIAGPFGRATIGGGQKKYNLVIIDDFSKKSWTITLQTKTHVNVKPKEWQLVQEN